jgi:hypothetical protein
LTCANDAITDVEDSKIRRGILESSPRDTRAALRILLTTDSGGNRNTGREAIFVRRALEIGNPITYARCVQKQWLKLNRIGIGFVGLKKASIVQM